MFPVQCCRFAAFQALVLGLLIVGTLARATALAQPRTEIAMEHMLSTVELRNVPDHCTLSPDSVGHGILWEAL